MVTCRLVDNLLIDIDERSFQYGGAWQIHPEPGAMRYAFGPAGLRWFYLHCHRVHKPVCLDIGANTGSYALMAKHHPSMKVYAYEPQRRLVDILRANVELNALTRRVKVIHAAVDDYPGAKVLYVPDAESAAGLALLEGTPQRFREWHEEEVYATTLDDIYAEIGPIDVVKVDTEGSELHILRGGELLIEECHPSFLLEAEDRNMAQRGKTVADMREFLQARDYRLTMLGSQDLAAVWEG